MRSNLKTREDDVTLSDESRSVYDAAYVGQLLSKHVQKSLSETLRVLSRIHENFTADRERELTKVKASATDVFEDAIEARSVYYRMAAAEAAPSKADFDARYLYLRACTNTREVSRSLQNLAKLARDHVANRHRVGSNEITNDIARSSRTSARSSTPVRIMPTLRRFATGRLTSSPASRIFSAA